MANLVLGNNLPILLTYLVNNFSNLVEATLFIGVRVVLVYMNCPKTSGNMGVLPFLPFDRLFYTVYTSASTK